MSRKVAGSSKENYGYEKFFCKHRMIPQFLLGEKYGGFVNVFSSHWTECGPQSKCPDFFTGLLDSGHFVTLRFILQLKA